MSDRFFIDDDSERFMEVAQNEAPVLLKQPLFEREIFRCPQCGCPVEFPLIARSSDIKHFATLLSYAEDFLSENGVTEKMLKYIIEKCTQMMIRKEKGFNEESPREEK